GPPLRSATAEREGRPCLPTLALCRRLDTVSDKYGSNPQAGEDRAEDEHDRDDEPQQEREHLNDASGDVRPGIPEEPGHDRAPEREPDPDRHRERRLHLVDHDGDRGGEGDDDRLHAEHARPEPTHARGHGEPRPLAGHRPAFSRMPASPTVTTEPVTTTPESRGSPSSASATARSIASSSRAARRTRSSPKTCSARSASSSTLIERGDEFRVTTSTSTTGSMRSRTASTSLSRIIASTAMIREKPNDSVSPSSMAVMPCGL